MSRLKLRATVRDGDGLFDQRVIEPIGRDAQTLQALMDAGPIGITAQDVGGWAVRLSHYIFKLRTVYEIDIETIEERHGGEYPGKHGRYTLRSDVRLVGDVRAA